MANLFRLYPTILRYSNKTTDAHLTLFMSPVIPPAQEIDDAAGPGAALGPEAGPATASPGPGPTPGPSLAPRGPRSPRPSPRLVPDPGPGLDPGLVPDLALGLEVPPQPRKEDPDRGLKVRPSLRQKMETKPKSDPRDAQ